MQPFLLFPHQLFEDVKKLEGYKVYLLETPLFFTQYTFHVQKLIFHRASMKYYEAYLTSQNIDVTYVEVEHYEETLHRLRDATCYDVADFNLQKSLQETLDTLTVYDSPNFYNTHDDTLFMHHFYANQRKRLNILMHDGKPQGGKWSFDSENRHKIPKGTTLPVWRHFENDYIKEARAYVKRFKTFGKGEPFYYATTHAEAKEVLAYFFEWHFSTFGTYQDAMTTAGQPFISLYAL